MKCCWNACLLLGTILPLVLHFWPLAWWGTGTLVVLRIIPALSAQLLLCRVGKHTAIKVVPMLITGALAGWIGYLYFMPPCTRSAAEVWMLFWEYFSPFVGCVTVYALVKLKEKYRNS